MPHVVAAVVLNDVGQLLLVREQAETWSVPGGHVEPNETLRQALRREGLEEIGVELVPSSLFATYEFGDGYSASAYYCHIDGGAPPTLAGVFEYGWFVLDALPSKITRTLERIRSDLLQSSSR
jgi:8-oxo-dGTP diphosphatase